MKQILFITALILSVNTYAQGVYVPGRTIGGHYYPGHYYSSHYYGSGGLPTDLGDFSSIGYSGNSLTPLGVNMSFGWYGISFRTSSGLNSDAPQGTECYSKSDINNNDYNFKGVRRKGWDLTTYFNIPLRNNKTEWDNPKKIFKPYLNIGIGAGFIYKYNQYESKTGQSVTNWYGWSNPAVVYTSNDDFNPNPFNISIGFSSMIKDEIKLGFEYNSCYKNFSFNISRVLLPDWYMKKHKVRKYKEK